MGYESMSVQELRAESQRRGLGTARSRAELIDRLATHDADTREPSLADGEHILSQAAVKALDAQPPIPAEEVPDDTAAPAPKPASSPAGPHAFHLSFPSEPGGPDEETHLAYRQATIQAAIEAGHHPRGDARLAETADSRWVYEVLVRQVT